MAVKTEPQTKVAEAKILPAYKLQFCAQISYCHICYNFTNTELKTVE